MRLLAAALFAVAIPALASTSLRTGDSVVLGHSGAGALVVSSADHPVLHFTETDGATMAMRITIGDGGGRVIILRANEERDVYLRDEFAAAELWSREVRVEALRGTGGVIVSGLEPQVDATTRRRRTVRVGGPLQKKPSSEGLIDAAEAAGTINAETALIYRLFAAFSDARLPQQYRGDDSKVRESDAVAEGRRKLDTLSDATQNIVQPFLWPPAYEGTWANVQSVQSSEPQALARVPPPCENLDVKWGWADSTNGKTRVWFKRSNPTDGPRAAEVAALIDSTIWPKISALLSPKVPLDDSKELNCNGGDGRLDIYIADVAISYVPPFNGCKFGPAFVVLKRTATNEDVAHEVFHAFQFAYETKACLKDGNYNWWTEGSAQWAMDFVFPSGNDEQKAAEDLMDYPAEPLDLNSKDHVYGTYLLPFYIARKTGDTKFVKTAWEGCKDAFALEAVDTAIGGFENVWKDFVLYNFNDETFDFYKQWDQLKDKAVLLGIAPRDVKLDGKLDNADPIKVDLRRLSAIYQRYEFNNENVRSVAFWNGVTFKLNLTEFPIAGVQYDPLPASAETRKGARVQALIKVEGQDWKYEDWTNRPYVTFCRDAAAERLRDLVIIISNSEFKDRDRRLKPEGELPLLFTSNMGCWQWKGTASYTLANEITTSTINSTATWTRDSETQSIPSVAYEPQGQEVWSLTIKLPPPHGTCTVGGTIPIGVGFGLTTFNYVPAQSNYRRSYVGFGTESRVINACGTPFGISPWLFHPLQPFVPNIPDARFLTVSADGKVMDGEFTPSNADGTWKWHFEAQREP